MSCQLNTLFTSLSPHPTKKQPPVPNEWEAEGSQTIPNIVDKKYSHCVLVAMKHNRSAVHTAA